MDYLKISNEKVKEVTGKTWLAWLSLLNKWGAKKHGRFELIYCEVCLNKDDVVVREEYLKSGMGKRYLKNRLT